MKNLIAALLLAPSLALANPCSELTSFVMLGYTMSEKGRPLWQAIDAINDGKGSEQWKEAKRTLVVSGYRAQRNGLSEVETYEVAMRSCEGDRI